ncbi:MAG: YdcF family protein [Patescibacteria group bacterium]
MYPLINEAREIATWLTDAIPEKKLPRVDAIFAFGHNLARTPEHASYLYHLGLAPSVIVTGHIGVRKTPLPAGFKTQGEFFVDVLNKNGVPKSRIIVEKQSTNTLENVIFGMRAAKEAGLSPLSLILCAVPVHLRRCRLTFLKQFPHVITYGSAFSWDETKLNDCLAWRLVDEVNRLVTYADKGDITPIQIPEAVAEACATIIQNYPPTT